MTLVKTKIVLDTSGHTIYMWHKSWWIFGHWYAYGHTSRTQIDIRINDITVSEILYNNLLQP
jgi:hypothetical protein